ncbi:hypothetical protein Tco_0503958 [Tanacetum coccineum]
MNNVNCHLAFDDRIRPAELTSYPYARLLMILGMDCHGFSGFCMDISLESPNIENLSVFREFAGCYFPDELLGLPPAREIESWHELIPVLRNLSQRLPYRMATVESRS